MPRHSLTPLVAAALVLPALAAVGQEPAPSPTPPPCAGPQHQAAQRLTGTWHEYTVTGGKEVLDGTLRTALRAGGCALVQEFTSVDASFSFSSVGYLEPESGNWHETFVFSSGRFARHRWHLEQDDIVVTCLTCREDRRLRITAIRPDVYDVYEEHSSDGGTTWTRGALTRTRRVPDAS